MREEINKGLTQKEAEHLLSKFGENSLEIKKQGVFLKLFVSQYSNSIALILFAASMFSLYINEIIDAAFILFTLFVNGLFGFFQEYKAEKTLEKLRDFTLPKTHVERNGEEKEIDTKLIVPGDLVILREGDRIPADGKLISYVPLEVDESIFTGESMPVEKEKEDLLLSGTFIMQGRGEMKVEHTGFETKLGQIAREMGEIQKPKTPLTQNIDVLGKRLALAAVVSSPLLIPIGLYHNMHLEQLVLTSISIAVAIIPEALPLVLTIALAVGAYKMAKEKTIVRKMAAIETLGTTNVILTDKTGTLTQNKMSVKKHWLFNPSESELLSRACVLGNSATLIHKGNGKNFDVMGDKTDAALLLFAKDNVADIVDFQSQGHIAKERPFDPISKTIEVEWEINNTSYEFVRGAPESILSLIKGDQKKHVNQTLSDYAREGLRVIGFAYRKKEEKPVSTSSSLGGDYSFLGLVGIYDPPRLEAQKTLEDANSAGIRVVMVTGDNPVTARSIAEEIGLIQQKEEVLTSEEIQKLTDKQLLDMLPRIRVFARMQPHDKLRLVKLYKDAGFIVGVTGDGVNDALALAQAHIGIAMGETGTDVAKEAADVIITDDNLATIIKAIEEGRGIFRNITTVVTYLLASNAAEFLVIFFGILIGLPILFSPTQILWINLVSDGFPALALAADTKRKGLLKLKPRAKNEQILNTQRMFSIIKIASLLTVATLLLYIVSLQMFSEQDARLVVFNMFVMAELLIAFIVRGSLFPINKFLLISVAISYVLQIILLTNPVLRSIFS